MVVSRSLSSVLRSQCARFYANERGAATVFALFILLVVLLFGGITIDVNNAWRYSELLKVTADVAAHAGAVTLAEGGTARAAEAAARKALELNMPEALFGRILAQPNQDVRAVHYNALNGTLIPGAVANAVEVRVQRGVATGNPVPTFLLKLAGFGSWNIAKESMAAVLPTERCRGNNGIYADGVLTTGLGLHVGAGYCLHSQNKVLPALGSVFADGAGLSMPDLTRCGLMCLDGMSEGASRAAFEANLIRGNLSTMISNIANSFAGPGRLGLGKATFFANRQMPDNIQALMPLDEVGVPLKGLATGHVVAISPAAFTRLRAVPQGLIYKVSCGADQNGKDRLGLMNGALTLGGGMQQAFYRNMALVTDCPVRIGPTAVVQGALIVSTRAGIGFTVTASPGARIGDPNDGCSPDRRTTIMALGSILIPAGVMDANVGIVAGGDISVPAPPVSGPVVFSLTGVGMHADGTVSLSAPHDLEACAGGGGDAFTPAIEVIRQVQAVAR